MGSGRRFGVRRGALVGLVALGAGLLTACDPPAAAQFLVVDTVADTVDAVPGDGVCADASGACSLRAAVMEANADPNVTEINVTGGETYVLSIPGMSEDAALTGDLDLLAPTYVRTVGGAGLATIDGGALDRVFDVHTSGTVWLKNLVITNGKPVPTENGGGVLVRAGDFRLEASRVTANRSSQSGGGVAGLAAAKMTFTGSTVDNNTAGGYGGGISAGGAVTLTQATVSGNQAGLRDGEVVFFSGALTMTASTITGDTIGLDLYAGSVPTLTRSVIDAPTACEVSIYFSSITSQGGNVASDGTCNLVGPSDQPSTPADLGPLADNGGPVPTRLPLAGSAAIDAVPLDVAGCTATVGTDARGITRPQGSGCDAGAVEAQVGEPIGADCGPPANLVAGAQLQNCDLTGTALAGVDLSGADLSGADFTGSTGRPTLSAGTLFADTTCPNGAVASVPCAAWLLTLTVNHGGDAVDSDPGDGICQDLSGPVGACSLRAAIDEANTDAAIESVTIDASVTTVTLTIPGANEDANATGDLDVTGEFTITGNGVTISADNLDRVLDVAGTGNLTIEGATLTAGSVGSQSGGAVRVGAGANVTLRQVSVTDSVAGAGGGLAAAAGATVDIEASTFSGNNASESGAAIDNSGATVTVSSSTIADNGGTPAVHVDGPTTIERSTITTNAGGIKVGGATPTLTATIVATQSTGADCDAAVTSGGYNLESATTCGFTATGDQQSTDPALTPLADHGGPTATRLAPYGSPAINQIPTGTVGVCDATTPTDQRGITRPQEGACDVGAVETRPDENVGADCNPLNVVPGARLQRCDLSGRQLAGADLTGADLTNANLSGAVVTFANLSEANLTGADLSDADLRYADLSEANLTDTTKTRGLRLAFATLTRATVTGADLTDADLAHLDHPWVFGVAAGLPRTWSQRQGSSGSFLVGPTVDLSGEYLRDVDLSGANLAGANLTGADLIDADLSGADLGGASLRTATVGGATVTGTDFSGADLTGLRHLGVGGQSFPGWLVGVPGPLPAPFSFRTGFSPGGYIVGPEVDLTWADLAGADLTGADLTSADLTSADLSGAVLSGADLTFADLSFADLTGADLAVVAGITTLANANLFKTDLTSADLTWVDLHAAEMYGTVLSNAVLTGADLSYVEMSASSLGTRSLFDGVDLTTADLTGLQQVGWAPREGPMGGTPDLPVGWSIISGFVLGPEASLSWLCDHPGCDALGQGVDLSGLDLLGVDLRAVDLEYADLTGTDLRNASLVGANLQGATLTSAKFERADLRSAQFGCAGDPVYGTCVQARYADFTEAILQDAEFGRADLAFAALASADLRSAGLDSASLAFADLSGAGLQNADLSGAILAGSVLAGADLGGANLTRADLTGATGLPVGWVNALYLGTICPTGVVTSTTCAGEPW